MYLCVLCDLRGETLSGKWKEWSGTLNAEL